MEMEEAMRLVKRLVDNIAAWQQAADRGRGTKTCKKFAEAHVRKLLFKLTGEQTWQSDIDFVLAHVGEA